MKTLLMTCSAAAALGLAFAPAHAADGITETFENTIPDQYNQGVYSGIIANTGLEWVAGDPVIRYDPSGAPGHGAFLELPTGWYSPNHDYAIGVGTSSVQSIATFDLLAGYEYSMTFDWSRRQGAAGNGPFPTSLTASLGSHSVSYQDVSGFYYLYDWTTATLSWTQRDTELGAHMMFTGSGDGYSGVALDNISLIGLAPAGGGGGGVGGEGGAVPAVPEPETYALMLAGLALMGCFVSRRHARQDPTD